MFPAQCVTAAAAAAAAAKSCVDGVTKMYAEANGGDAKAHGGNEHNGAIDKLIDDLKNDPAVDNDSIRKNQQQVDVNGNKVGNNRPDVQYDKDGCHYCVEYDHDESRSDKHGDTIRGNDPNAVVDLYLL